MSKNFPIQMLQQGGAVQGPLRLPKYRGGEYWEQALAKPAQEFASYELSQKKKKPKPTPQPEGMQQGGEAEGNTDTVPIMATPGEHVMNRGAVAIAGRPYLDYLNAIGMQHPAMQPAKHLRPKKRQSEG